MKKGVSAKSAGTPEGSKEKLFQKPKKAHSEPIRSEKLGKEEQKSANPHKARQFVGALARHKAVFAIVALVTLALVSFIAGWFAQQEFAALRVHEEASPEVVRVPIIKEGVQMPDVRGLNKDAALQVLADIGWDPSEVKFVAEPQAGPENIVVSQTPTFGVTNIEEITLSISTKTTVPSIEGRKADDVISELRKFGVDVTTKQSYSSNTPVGGVIAIEPNVGEFLPTAVTVTIARSGTAKFLKDIKSVDRSFSQSSATLNGQSFNSVLTSSVSYYKNSSTPSETVSTYVLGRHANEFHANIGVPDDSKDTSIVFNVQLIGDGKELASQQARYGTVADLSADVTGVLRLEIKITWASPPSDNSSSGTVAFGDARVVGADAEIKQIESR